MNVEIPSAYGATETIIFSRDSVTFANNEYGDMAASIDTPMPFTEAGLYRVKIGNRSGIINILQQNIDEWNEQYNDNQNYDIDLSASFIDEKNLSGVFPNGFYYSDNTLDLSDGSIEAGEYSVSITKVDTKPSIKMDKVNPTGVGSFSLNRKNGTVVGAYSHAEGRSATASGHYSHAEGFNTTASGISSHAEGDNTTASGISSHAEGYSTEASSTSQHVQGKYNIKDSSNVYADIIGNGTSLSECSNAATVDWSGNAWYAGDVYVGSTSGTNKDEGSKKLATEEYVDNSVIVPAPSSADNGKILRVVDGKATWVSLPSASGVSF